MKSIVTQVIILLLFTAPAWPQAPGSVQALVNAVKERVAKDPGSDPRESAAPMREWEEYKALQTRLRGGWKPALDNLQTVAPDSLAKAILMDALQGLAAKEYLKCANKALDLYKSGDLDEVWLLDYLLFSGGDKWGFFDVNFRDPRVVQFLQELKAALPKGSTAIGSIDNILSGEGEKTVENNMRDNPDYQRRLVQWLSLPPKPSAQKLLTGVYTYIHIRGVDSGCIDGFESEAVLEMVSQLKKGENSKVLLLTSLRRAVSDLKLSDEALKAARDQLYAGLTDSDPRTRMDSLWLVTDLDRKKATDVLLQAVDDTDAGVQATAFLLLGTQGDPASIGRLEEVLKNRDTRRNTPQALPESPHFRDEAAKALLQMRERAAKEGAGKKP